MPAVIHPSFARGELSPVLFGRVDTAAYQVGLRTALNCVIHAYGGVSNRPGLEFVGPQKEHTYAARLIAFKFKTTDTYVLEFGDEYIRVIRDDAHVTETAQNITNMTQADPIVVTVASHGYSTGDEVALDAVVGMTEVNGRRFQVTALTADTFSLQDQATGTDVDGTGYTAYTSGGTAAKVYEIVTPYAQADLAKLKFVQSADVMTLVHPSYEPRELTRTDHDAWTLSVIEFLPKQDHPTGLDSTRNGASGSTEYRYQVTAIADETFEESLPALNTTSVTITGATQANPVVVTAAAHGFLDGEEVEINSVLGMTELNGRRFIVANKTTDTFELKNEDGSAYGAYSSGGTANLTFTKITDGNATLSTSNNIDITWTEVAGAQRYEVYKYENGLYGLLGETEETDFRDDGSKEQDLASTPPRFREPFRGTNKAPGAVGYYEQRRVLGGANDTPDTSDYSRTADQSNFTTATPARADDAIRATLNSLEVNEIRFYVPLDDLLIFTSGEEWRVNSGSENRFSADTLRQKPQSRWGCAHLRPVVIGRVVLFVQENSSAVRSIGYELAVDGYTGTDMSLLANHLFRDYILTDWSVARSPDPVIYGVRADGFATVLTFNQEQEVIAWSRWQARSPDKFEAVTTIRPSSDDVDDAAYFVVKRSINGNTVRYIERTHDRRFLDIKDCFFVDSGLSYNSPIAVSGVSLTDPVVLTVASGHGLVAGDEVDISDIVWVPDVDDYDNETQPAQLNGGRFKVSAADATTITLQTQASVDVDATGFNAYVEDGNVRKAVTTLSGYHHLAGETAAIALADGNVLTGLTVSATGQVTLPRKFSRVHLGLKYVADIETLDIAVQGGDQVQGRRQNVHEVVLRLDRSRGIWVGPDKTRMTEVKFRRTEAYGEPTQLFSGDVKVTVPPFWNSNGRVFIRQRNPLPMTLLAALPRFEMEGQNEE